MIENCMVSRGSVTVAKDGFIEHHFVWVTKTSQPQIVAISPVNSAVLLQGQGFVYKNDNWLYF